MSSARDQEVAFKTAEERGLFKFKPFAQGVSLINQALLLVATQSSIVPRTADQLSDIAVLLHANADVNCQIWSESIIHMVVANNNGEVLQFLLNSGAHIHDVGAAVDETATGPESWSLAQLSVAVTGSDRESAVSWILADGGVDYSRFLKRFEFVRDTKEPKLPGDIWAKGCLGAFHSSVNARTLGMCMGNHPRLGADSLFILFDDDVMRMIHRVLWNTIEPWNYDFDTVVSSDDDAVWGEESNSDQDIDANEAEDP